MTTPVRLLSILFASLLLQSCGSSGPVVSIVPTESSPDGSTMLSVSTWSGSDSISFGSARVREENFVAVGDGGDSITARVWYPGGAVDGKSLVVLIPDFDETTFSLAPLALETVRLGLPTMMLSYRGSELNPGLGPTYGVREVDDVSSAIMAFQRSHRAESVRVGIFGASLGGVVALNAARRDRSIQSVVAEGVMPSLEEASQAVLSSDQYASAASLLAARGESMQSYSPSVMLPYVRPIPILMIWGKEDPLVSPDQRMVMKDAMRARVATSMVAEIPGAGHNLRYGFPLTASDARALNERIAKFLAEALR
jgi:pimeloyl-ACP methyl ester carboxylesterase